MQRRQAWGLSAEQLKQFFLATAGQRDLTVIAHNKGIAILPGDLTDEIEVDEVGGVGAEKTFLHQYLFVVFEVFGN